MKSLMMLLQGVLADASTWCCTSTTLDYKLIERRVEHEGVSFLTITLPSFCSEFERALDQGYVDHDMFKSFKRSKRGGLPRFLGGFLGLVFDPTGGRLRDHPSEDAIFFIRQITLMCKKILLPCSPERVRKAFDGYIACEKEVEHWQQHIPERDISRFGRVADIVWGSDLSQLDRKVYAGDLTPKHGPGATAERVIGNDKFVLRRWHSRLEDYFPSSDFVIPNWGFYDEIESVNFLEPGAELPVRVITVPKTLKTPRIIAIEPVCMQYTQQSLLEIIVDQIEKSDILHGSIGFTDQVPNQRLACRGSQDGSLATIDLSEASDRVSNLLVKRLFSNYPSLAGAIQACRSERADVPGHGVISLSKFASMGSALCFPVEAMVFFTIVLCAVEKELNRPLTIDVVQSVAREVRIYGDDIIVPVKYVRSVICELELFGLRVNSRKSFWTGKFRESCGRDYYNGHDVTVTYVRRMIPDDLSNASEMMSAVSLRNQLYKAGLWNAANVLDQHLRRFAPLPTVLETSPVLGRHSFLGFETQRMCDQLHRPLVRGLVTKSKPKPSKLDGHGALLKFFLKRGEEPYHDVKHLERYGRPESVDIKIRWASAT